MLCTVGQCLIHKSISSLEILWWLFVSTASIQISSLTAIVSKALFSPPCFPLCLSLSLPQSPSIFCSRPSIFSEISDPSHPFPSSSSCWSIPDLYLSTALSRALPSFWVSGTARKKVFLSLTLSYVAPGLYNLDIRLTNIKYLQYKNDTCLFSLIIH